MGKKKEKEWLKPAGVFLAGKVFTDLAKKAYEREWYETAINIFDIAEGVLENAEAKVPICIYKSKAHRALANMEDSRYEAEKALSFNRESKGVLPYLNVADLLYNENEFEEAVTKYVKGNQSKNPNFQRGIYKTLGTLSNCVGDNAGDMFDKDVLGGAVERMKQETLGLAPPVKKLTADEKLARSHLLRTRKKYLAGRYLGKISADLVFLDKMQRNKDMKLGAPYFVSKTSEIIENTIDKLEKKQNLLWHRKPLYSFYSRVRAFQTSDYAIQFEKRKRELDRKMLDKNIFKQLKEFITLKNEGKYIFAYSRMLRLRNRLKYIDSRQLPMKEDYQDLIIESMGDMYLRTKKLLPQLSQHLNDVRIKCCLGMYRTSWPTPIEEVYHITLKYQDRMKKMFLQEIENTDDLKEKAYFNYEVACIIGMKPESGGDMKKYCFKVYDLAKRSNSVTWFLNSLFLIARAAFTDNRFPQGLLTIMAAREACNNYSKPDQVEFLDRALLLLQYMNQQDFIVKRSSLAVERKVLSLMPKEQQKAEAAEFMIELTDIPSWRRMTMPGAGSLKQREQELRDLRPFPTEKFDESELVVPKNNWIAGLDDTQPYHIKDIWTDEQKKAMLEQVYGDKKYSRFLSMKADDSKSSMNSM